MYAVVLGFSEEIDQFVRGVWKQLHEKGITSHMQIIPGMEPHISIALYSEKLPIEEFLGKIKNLAIHEISVGFDLIGIFPTTSTVFMAPTITNELFLQHKAFYEALDAYTQYAESYYLPNKWTPHCTLGIHLTPDNLIPTFEHCMRSFMPLKGSLNRLAIFKVEKEEPLFKISKLYETNLISEN